MATLLGIDLGTSAVKAVVIDEAGRVLGTGTREIPMEVPEPLRAEQDPEKWWSNTIMAVRAALHQAGVREVAAIGLGGHMHGGVLLDASHRPVGRAITWADQRSAELIPEIEDRIGIPTFLRMAGTRPAAGFMAPTLVWLQRHDPGQLERAAVYVLPKDYLRLRLTGLVASDISDASATALFDITARRWSAELCSTLGLPEAILPVLLESADVAGPITAAAAEELGLPVGVPVVAGCVRMLVRAHRFKYRRLFNCGLPLSHFAEAFASTERGAGRGDAETVWRAATPDEIYVAVAGGPGPQNVYIGAGMPQTRLIRGI